MWLLKLISPTVFRKFSKTLSGQFSYIINFLDIKILYKDSSLHDFLDNR